MDYQVFDTTLRDGAQREGISYSVADKLAVARLLDEFGVGFIEGGWPGAMPKDTEFFERAKTELDLRNALLVAFGSTRKAGVDVAKDQQVQALLDAGTPVVCLVAKSDIRHVVRALRTTGEENLAMVRDTVAYFVEHGRRVFLDCEHFFDGFRYDPAYTASVVKAAFEGGAERVVMCDTNGGMLPSMITKAVEEVVERTGVSADRLGIHCQNDTSCAVANTIAAVEAGVKHFQCTANGYGERPGNADLFATVSNVQLKLGLQVLPDGCLEKAARVSTALAEIANIAPDTHQAYVGAAAFAHKAGLHASAIKVDPLLYNHVDPSVVGNDMRILVTEMAGRASIELKSRELGLDLAGHPDALSTITQKVKDLEAGGWSFEAADASFELLVRGELPGEGYLRPFTLESYRVLVEHREDGSVVSEATVKVRVRGERVIATAEGVGPVNALDEALRVALSQHYPQLKTVELTDYKVRILEGSHGTNAVTRVLLETGDREREWTTVGVHENIVEASWVALVDALTYGLARTSTPA
ncbi:citramalate synthase [Paractinoplanes globisporus]|uniref:Citramalate synthase n=1 Tax=Paractinoplanes globisporus TaxID=113565 RepID=A0ABW6WMR8_9ACTN|nr:citramalate synthase [Actinoplanes globisporus]